MLDPQFVIDETEPEQPKAARKPSADKARKWLRDQLRSIMWDALIWNLFWKDKTPELRIMCGINPPHSALEITTGVGKSELIRQAIADQYIPEAKREKLPHRVLIALPTHKLAGEARERMPDGITVAVWQGRDGAHLATGEPMCRNPAAVAAAIKVGADVQETACKHKNARCPFFADCHYQLQKKTAAKADVVLAAHETLFQVPTAIGKGFGLAIVDEAFWQKGVVGKNGEGFLLAIDRLDHELAEFPVRYKGVTKVESYTSDLRNLIRQLQNALAQMPDGHVRRQPLIDAGLVPKTLLNDSSCKTAGKLEWQRKVKTTGLRPGLDEKQVKKLASKFGFLGQLRRRAAMWHKLDDLIAGNEEISGQLRLETKTTEEGSVRQLRIMGRKEIAEGVISMPIIHADATLQFDLTRHYLPNLELIGNIKVAAPHMRITQVVGLPVGISSLRARAPGKRRNDEEMRVSRKRQRLAEMVRHVAQGRRSLVITHKDIEADFANIENVETGHFGAVEGIDRWSTVEVAFIIGRPLPRPEGVAKLAIAITGKPVEVGDMVEQEHAIRLTNGTGRTTITCRICEDPDAEMVRQAITYSAIEQAIGRVRGVNRDAGNPVEVYLIIHDVVVPDIEVDEVVEFGDLEPDAIDHMIARGLVPQMPGDAAKLCPDFFPNREAAKKAYQRDRLRPGSGGRGPRLGTFPIKNSLYRRCPQPPCVALLIQPCGRGQLARICMVDPAKVPNPKAVLEAALGPLARFELLEPEPEAEPEPIFPGDRPWPEADPDLEPLSPKEWLETALRGLPATF